MNDNLYGAFQSYLNLVQSKIHNYREQPKVKKHLTLIKHAVVELEEIENSHEFNKLDQETLKLESTILRGGWSYSDAIKNWFRRSGVYLEIINNKRIDVEGTFQKYLRAFQKKEIKTTYFLPLGLVHFNVESLDEVFDFGPFQIGFFDNPQFRDIFQVEIRNIFYPDASIPVENLYHVPFICIEELAGSLDYDNSLIHPTDKLKNEYTHFPERVESILKIVALFDWENIIEVDPSGSPIEQGQKRYWQGFEIPFILQVDNNILKSPRRSPDLSELRLITKFYPSTKEYDIYPESAFTFEYHEIDKFKNFIRDIDKSLSILKLHSEAWNLVDSALGFFLKAFFTKGIEQLLWHITALEALLIERGEPITKSLANRVSVILGNTNAEKKNIVKDINRLYEFRSAIVHGRKHDLTVWVGELFKARSYSRKILIWFLNCLSLIAEDLPQDLEPTEFPSKDMILKFIDLDHKSRKLLNNILPDKFPQI